MARTEFSSAIPLASKVVPFVTAARLGGAMLPAPSVKGTRAFCPFGEFSHPDEGRDKALRIYPDHGFCFAEWLWLSPVKIFALLTDLDEETAASELLVRAGVKAADYTQLWLEAVQHELAPDHSSLAQALRTWLNAAYPGEWNDKQYDPLVSGALAGCLGLLGLVRTKEDCQSWLNQSKQVMQLYMRRAG